MILWGIKNKDDVVVFCGFQKKNKSYTFSGDNCLENCLLSIITLGCDSVIFTNLVWIMAQIHLTLKKKTYIINLKYDINKNKSGQIITFKVHNKGFTIKTLQNYLNLESEDMVNYLGWSEAKPERKNDNLDLFNYNVTNLKKIVNDLDFTLSKIHKYWWKKKTIAGVSGIFFNKNREHSLEHLTNDVINKLAQSRWGGRCLLNEPGLHINLVELDFIGMYSHELLKGFPITCLGIHYGMNHTSPGFHYAKVFSNLSTPLLPHTHNEKTVYENGCFEGLYWYEELLAFVEFGGIIKAIEYSILFEDFKDLYKKGAEECIHLRSFGSNIENIIYKAIPNSYIGLLWYNFKTDIAEISSAYPLIISSRARIRWYRKLLDLNQIGCKFIYGDTDSFFVLDAAKHLENLSCSDLKRKEYRYAFFYKKKKYILCDHNNIKKYVGLTKSTNIWSMLNLPY